MQLLVTDRDSVGGLIVRVPYAVISIRSAGRRRARVPRPGHCLAVLYLCFDDAEPVAGLQPKSPVQLMSPGQAAQIWAFVDKHRGQTGAILVHCEAGMSRSPAVAAAICRAMGQDDRTYFQTYQPNLHVYRTLLEARGLKPST